MKNLILAAIGAGAMMVMSGVSADAQQRPRGFSDDQGQFRGQLWCFRRDFYYQDCNYYTYQQCMATAFGQRGVCQQNPWSLNAQPSAASGPKKRKKDRRSR